MVETYMYAPVLKCIPKGSKDKTQHPYFTMDKPTEN